MATATATTSLENDDIAIVGAGLAGLASAYRLAAAYPGRPIRVYEASSRFGGRLWSRRMAPNSYPVELGALSFSSAHEYVCGLADNLNLARTPIVLAGVHHYLRGSLAKANSCLDANTRRYRLQGDEATAQGASQILLRGLNAVVPDLIANWPWCDEAARIRADQSLRSVEVRGMPICDWGLRSLLTEHISHEAYAFMTAALGSDASFANVNAFDAISNLLWEARPDQQHYRLTDGYEALARALVAACGNRVAFLPRRELKIVDLQQGGITLHFDVYGQMERVKAGAVILALPSRALRAVAFKDDLLGAQFSRDLTTVSVASACKLYLRFEAPWWTDVNPVCADGETIGVSYTDLPMRQCYYLDAGSTNGAALVMAAYADGEGYDYWSWFRGRSDSFEFGQEEGALVAPGAMVEAALGQLRAMHPNAVIGAPIAATFVDWGQKPHNGAWHAWRPHVRSWDVRERMRQPNPNHPIFVCGEAFAQRQGWCEGALNNAEMVLERHFGLSRPSWVRPQYPLEY